MNRAETLTAVVVGVLWVGLLCASGAFDRLSQKLKR